MLSGRSSAMTAREPEPLWSRWLNHLVEAARGLSARRRSSENREPVFRIAQLGRECWMVERPGASVEHAFSGLEAAVAFIRNESATPATVELRIGDLYVVARFDPRKTDSLFGEAAP